MSILVQDSNKTACRAAEAGLQQKNCAALVRPAGTGKGCIVWELLDAHPEMRVLWVVSCAARLELRRALTKRLGRTQVEVARVGEVAQDQTAKGLSGRSESVELYELLTPDEVSRQFARDDRLKRQLVMWAGHHPLMIQRVVYYDRDGPLAPYL